MPPTNRISRNALLAVAAIIAVTALTLWLMGRVPICKCGYVKLWEGAVNSSGNSQHLTDWYTFSHVIHGIGFYAVLSVVARRLPLRGGQLQPARGRLPLDLRLVLAVAMEATWEILENTPMVIDRYRTVTIALDYYGDSVLNSVSDILAMVLGFFIARRLPVRVTVALVAAMELGVGAMIRDNLTLNIIMLIHPFEVIRQWQSGL